ncbi:uncharacterized protein LOC121774877 isoform X2 [Salvia splendens]|uniref:uncharacterized protein LOC121774877 isoform X2 n=1 Tax=Salvia splendens TaxID=180675 RepID=UPI001C26A2F9|nr:uncharacterized protein LOC121774877 isoform X2 [Salvia splendens]
MHMGDGLGLRFIMLKYTSLSMNYCCIDEVELKDGTERNLEELEFKGNCLHQDIPADPGIVCVGDTMYMFGGDIYSVPLPVLSKQIRLTNYLSFAPLPSDSSPVTWNRSPTGMSVDRVNPMVAPLHDGRIFICGGTYIRSSWAEVYDPKTCQFLSLQLPMSVAKIPIPRSCFQYTNELVLIYYDAWFYNQDEYEGRARMSCNIEGYEPTLLQYNLVSNYWQVFARELPEPYYETYKRNLVYVGGDILFMMDYSSSWLVYNLSSKKVGNLEVELPDTDVIEAFYVGNTHTTSTSWVFYVFLRHMVNYTTSGVRYAKVEVVQGKDGDYIATVQMNGVLRVRPFSDMHMFGFKARSKRDAEEQPLEKKGKEKMMRIE